MELWTLQLSRWRWIHGTDIEPIDTTVKNVPNGIFSPTWDIVRGVKQGQITEAEYTRVYKELIRERWQTRRSEFQTFLDKPKVAVMCFCPAGCFCHRLILVDLIKGLHRYLNKPFIYQGEILTEVKTE